jgi:hypothetical protein
MVVWREHRIVPPAVHNLVEQPSPHPCIIPSSSDLVKVEPCALSRGDGEDIENGHVRVAATGEMQGCRAALSSAIDTRLARTLWATEEAGKRADHSPASAHNQNFGLLGQRDLYGRLEVGKEGGRGRRGGQRKFGGVGGRRGI